MRGNHFGMANKTLTQKFHKVMLLYMVFNIHTFSRYATYDSVLKNYRRRDITI